MSWFPIAEDMLENEAFRQLTPTEKIYYLWCISEYNLHGEFYRSDLEVAVTLDSAEITIRKARRKLVALGWLTIKPGMRARGRGLATRYIGVKWSAPEECEWFAQQRRIAFSMILASLRMNKFQPGDVWVYLCLGYYQWRYRGSGDEYTFTVSKSDLAELSGLHDVGERVRRLYDGFQYSTGNHLFEVEGYHRLTFSIWSLPCEPDEDENVRKIADMWTNSIKEQAKTMRLNALTSTRQFADWNARKETERQKTHRGRR